MNSLSVSNKNKWDTAIIISLLLRKEGGEQTRDRPRFRNGKGKQERAVKQWPEGKKEKKPVFE